jgi:geranylgeranyl pyrophosphate synthase
LGADHDPGPLKRVPSSRKDRESIRERAAAVAAGLDRSRPLSQHAIRSRAEAILQDLDLPEHFLGWAMVAMASAFWRQQVEAIPHHRRLILLPHCLRKADTCPAKYDQLGLLCEDCGACRLAELRAAGEAKGCQVLIAEGSPTVIELILRGQADALLGAACLNSLEKALDKILLAGIPCMAVPLLTNSCRDTTTDLDWVREMIETPYRGGAKAQTYLHLLRLATRLFEPEELARLVPRRRAGPTLAEADAQGSLDAIAATETIAHDFLGKGGKHFRPFITLAAYDAMTGGRAAGPDGESLAAAIPDSVRRVALAIEVFHKASLVHDDIEDDDAFRYGHPALHRRFGAATAINVGDYLIGLGYRLVADQRAELPAATVGDLLGCLADAHTKLCEGQGAELAWRLAADKRLTPLDALKIYALKTSPAFEAALFAGLRLAGPAEEMSDLTARFARHLGVAFQVLNDLDDWQIDEGNKLTRGADVLGGRPTVLWALAQEHLAEADRLELDRLVIASRETDGVLDRVRELYVRAGVFEMAAELVAKHRQRAHALVQSARPRPLSELLHYLTDTILRG